MVFAAALAPAVPILPMSRCWYGEAWLRSGVNTEGLGIDLLGSPLLTLLNCSIFCIIYCYFVVLYCFMSFLCTLLFFLLAMQQTVQL